ncbi:hypothetical protein ACFFQW_36000 [Umezawaea endophytica]|uniref:Uncharacterized protein n=1 Tax=Umezawaea endophytica TaxID=1654476 RepID=A0A9X3A110_9PSEU|nr:hypothetical protein [Umezawaea endophytica]MCS7477508.1 hypothetical protein [Umezawaea endophytica]
MTEIRNEVVLALVSASEAAKRELGTVVDVYEPTLDEQRAAAKMLMDESVEGLEDAGVIKQHSVLNLRRPQLAALAMAYAVAVQWWMPRESQRSLGDMLKIIPAEEAQNIRTILEWSGFIPADTTTAESLSDEPDQSTDSD